MSPSKVNLITVAVGPDQMQAQCWQRQRQVMQSHCIEHCVFALDVAGWHALAAWLEKQPSVPIEVVIADDLVRYLVLPRPSGVQDRRELEQVLALQLQTQLGIKLAEEEGAWQAAYSHQPEATQDIVCAMPQALITSLQALGIRQPLRIQPALTRLYNYLPTASASTGWLLLLNAIAVTGEALFSGGYSYTLAWIESGYITDIQQGRFVSGSQTSDQIPLQPLVQLLRQASLRLGVTSTQGWIVGASVNQVSQLNIELAGTTFEPLPVPGLQHETPLVAAWGVLPTQAAQPWWGQWDVFPATGTRWARYRRWRWLIAGCGLIALSLGGWAYHHQQQATDQRQQFMAWVQQRQQQPQQPTATFRLSKSQTKAINDATATLNLPWERILWLLEQVSPADATLLAIEPDATRQRIRLRLEAKHPEAMLAYVAALEDQAPVRYAVLTRHEVMTQNQGMLAQAPVRFEVELAWIQEALQ